MWYNTRSQVKTQVHNNGELYISQTKFSSKHNVTKNWHVPATENQNITNPMIGGNMKKKKRKMTVFLWKAMMGFVD